MRPLSVENKRQELPILQIYQRSEGGFHTFGALRLNSED